MPGRVLGPKSLQEPLGSRLYASDSVLASPVGILRRACVWKGARPRAALGLGDEVTSEELREYRGVPISAFRAGVEAKPSRPRSRNRSFFLAFQ